RDNGVDIVEKLKVSLAYSRKILNFNRFFARLYSFYFDMFFSVANYFVTLFCVMFASFFTLLSPFAT
ncbi:MAG: hypothetical protein RRZ69_04955, partial [Clostridia bacterium]